MTVAIGRDFILGAAKTFFEDILSGKYDISIQGAIPKLADIIALVKGRILTATDINPNLSLEKLETIYDKIGKVRGFSKEVEELLKPES